MGSLIEQMVDLIRQLRAHGSNPTRIRCNPGVLALYVEEIESKHMFAGDSRTGYHFDGMPITSDPNCPIGALYMLEAEPITDNYGADGSGGW